jgi:hypothetical protein
MYGMEIYSYEISIQIGVDKKGYCLYGIVTAAVNEFHMEFERNFRC